MRLQGKVAVVTGAGAGLGRAVALRFGSEGACVAAVSIDGCELEEVARTATERGFELLPIQADVGNVEDTDRVTAAILVRFGRVDVLVNNAAIISVKPIEETSVAEWDRVLATNLRGPFLYCRACVPVMKRQGQGTIINVSSQSGIKGFVGESAYCPSKFGLEGLTYTLALELAPWHIRCVVVHPGAPMRTPMSMTTYDEESRKVWRDPMELAPGFVALAASDDPSISGRRFSAWELAQEASAG